MGCGCFLIEERKVIGQSLEIPAIVSCSSQPAVCDSALTACDLIVLGSERTYEEAIIHNAAVRGEAGSRLCRGEERHQAEICEMSNCYL